MFYCMAPVKQEIFKLCDEKSSKLFQSEMRDIKIKSLVFQNSLCEHHFQSLSTIFTRAFLSVSTTIPISGYGYGGYNYGNWGDYTHPGYTTQPQEPALRCKLSLRKHQINWKFYIFIACLSHSHSLSLLFLVVISIITTVHLCRSVVISDLDFSNIDYTRNSLFGTRPYVSGKILTILTCKQSHVPCVASVYVNSSLSCLI